MLSHFSPLIFSISHPRFLMFERLQLQAAKAYAKKPKKGAAARPFLSKKILEEQRAKRSRQDHVVEDEFSSTATPETGEPIQTLHLSGMDPVCSDPDPVVFIP